MATPFLFPLSMLAGVMAGVRGVTGEYMMEDIYLEWLIGQGSDAGSDWGQEEEGMTED